MLLQELKLRLNPAPSLSDPHSYDFVGGAGGWWCASIMMRILRSTFELPERPRRLWLEAHDEPADDRARVAITRRGTTDYFSYPGFIIALDGKRRNTGVVPCSWPLEQQPKTATYLEVYYQE